MSVVSIRFSDEALYQRVRDRAQAQDTAISTLSERLIDEGLRMEDHRLVMFRDGPAGRRSVLIGGPEVSDVIGAMIGGDVPMAERVPRAARHLGLTNAQIEAALAYYADFTDEIDAERAARIDQADKAEASWRRQRELLNG